PLRRKMNPMSIGMTTMGVTGAGDSAERIVSETGSLPLPTTRDSAEKALGISVVKEFTMTQQGASTVTLEEGEPRPRDVEMGVGVGLPRPSVEQGRPDAFAPSTGYSVRIQ